MTRNFLSLGWTSAVPIGRSLKRIDAFSPRGASLDMQFRIHPRVSIGPSLNWQMFDVVERETTIMDGNEKPIGFTMEGERRFFVAALTAHLYLLKRQTMLPYLGLGIGAARVRNSGGAQSRDDESSSWHFQANPEVGIFLLHGRIPVWLCSQLRLVAPSADAEGDMVILFTLGITVPN